MVDVTIIIMLFRYNIHTGIAITKLTYHLKIVVQYRIALKVYIYVVTSY